MTPLRQEHEYQQLKDKNGPLWSASHDQRAGMNVLDLFSGIGGFSLGLERAGMRTVAFVEIDPYCQAVLRKHWPDVPVYGDVRELAVDEGWLVSNADKRCEPAQEQLCAGRQRIRADCIDVIAGGFPCQDISVAGKGAGIGGERSGLWSEYARIIGEVRPRYVIVENVAALLGRGLDRVLGDLAALGFDAEWHCIPASAVGAPHRRDRVWIVAHCNDKRAEHPQSNGGNPHPIERGVPRGCGADVADANSGDGHRRGGPLQMGWGRIARQIANDGEFGRIQWGTEPAMGELVDGLSGGLVRFEGRVARGVPNRANKLRALRNAVVPQIPEIIGRAIMSAALEPKS
jgi:DNA (cytosine-5)-methyltransferase 1